MICNMTSCKSKKYMMLSQNPPQGHAMSGKCPGCLQRLCSFAAGSKLGKENAPRNVPAAIAGENSKSLVRPSSAKRKLEKLGSLKQSTLHFAKKASTGSAAKERAQPAAKPAPATSDNEPIVID